MTVIQFPEPGRLERAADLTRRVQSVMADASPRARTDALEILLASYCLSAPDRRKAADFLIKQINKWIDDDD